MKKLMGVLLCVLLLCSLLPVTAAAYSGMPVIASNPANISVPEGGTGIWTCEVEGDDAHELDYEWHLVFNGTDYKVDDIDIYVSNPIDAWPFLQYIDLSSALPIGRIGNTLMISGMGSELDGAEVYCVVYNGSYSNECEHARVMVTSASAPQPPTISTPAYVTCAQNDSIVLKCNVEMNGSYGSREFIWYKAVSNSLSTMTAVDPSADSSISIYPDTSAPGIYYYYCGVIVETNGETNYSYSGVTVVEVMERETLVELEITNQPTKLTYVQGEEIDLSGMACRIWSSEGFADIYNGEDLTVSPQTLDKVGTQTVTVQYENLTATFEVTVKAAAPDKPVIVGQPVTGNYTMDDTPANLSVIATADADCKLTYQWYYTSAKDSSVRHNIEGATASAFTPSKEEGTKFYGCAVTAVNSDGKTSETVYTDLVAVTFTAVIPTEQPAAEPETPDIAETEPAAAAEDAEAEDIAEDAEEEEDEEDEEEEEKTTSKKSSSKSSKDDDEDDEDDEESGTSIWLFLFIGVAVLLVGAGATITVLLLKRKNPEF